MMEVMLMSHIYIDNKKEQHTPGVGDKSVSLAAKPRILFSPPSCSGRLLAASCCCHHTGTLSQHYGWCRGGQGPNGTV